MVWNHSRGVDIQPVVLMTTFVDNIVQANELCINWKLSNFDKTLCCFIASHRSLKDDREFPLKPYQDLIIRKGGSHIVEMVQQLLIYKGKIKESVEIGHWTIPKFPINGGDLIKCGIKPGPDFGKLMNTLKELWIESRYTLTKDLLFEEV